MMDGVGVGVGVSVGVVVSVGVSVEGGKVAVDSGATITFGCGAAHEMRKMKRNTKDFFMASSLSTDSEVFCETSRLKFIMADFRSL